MDDEKLIELVQKSPWLYDKQNTDFKNQRKKRRTWKEIANNLEVEESLIEKRWRNLRERFSKEIRNMQNTSGSGACEKRRWELLDNLQFLRGHIIPRPMRQSAPILKCKEECDASEIMLNMFSTESQTSTIISPAPSTPMSPAQSIISQSIPIPTAPSTSKSKKRKAVQIDESEAVILKAVKMFQEASERNAHREEISAEICGFRDMICAAISKLKKRNQALVMQRCTDIVMQAVIDEHDEV